MTTTAPSRDTTAEHARLAQATARAEDDLFEANPWCLALALWNGVDPILKERMFGLTGPQGNHSCLLAWAGLDCCER